MNQSETQAMLFIQKSNAIHNSFYLYEDLFYINNKTKVFITCPIHGKFTQSPNSHLSGRGCPLCGNKKRGNSNSSNTKEFISKSKEIHIDEYDYSTVNYKNNYTPVKIICKIHGEFSQKPLDHLRGSGCPICKKSKGENKIRKFLIDSGFDFFQQSRFEGCVGDNRKLPFDFYIPELNMCIEYDGEQHFTEKFNGKRLTKVKEYDKIKNNFCDKNSIHLIRIPFTEIRNIEKILSLRISKIKQSKQSK